MKRVPGNAMQAVCAAGGVLLMAWGLGQIYAPLTPIFVGLMLLIEVLTSSRRNP